jgi:hypothetical protein
MAEHGIVGAKRRGKPWWTTRADPAALRSPDLVERDLTATRPNALWVADFTYLRCWEGVVYFSFVIDVFSRMIVGWQLAANMRTTLVDALRMALGVREHGADVELVHHSGAGSQYTAEDYTQELTDHVVLGSIGTVGDAYDNALAQSVVDSYTTELIADRVWRSRAELELATVQWVAWFNTVLAARLARRHPADRVRSAQHARTGQREGRGDGRVERRGRAHNESRRAARPRACRTTRARSVIAPAAPGGALAQAAPTAVKRPTASGGPSDLRVRDILPLINKIPTTKRPQNPPNSVSAEPGSAQSDP